MPKLEPTAVLAALLAASPASAQQQGGMSHGHAADSATGASATSILPQGCIDAIEQGGMSEMMQGMNMSGMMGDMGNMDEAQTASMKAMMEMNSQMMATHAIKDPDLAFHCGMIVHHAGAIAMSEVVLKYGDDEQTKAMAQKIIDAQRPEIEEMKAWVEQNAGR